MSNETSNSDEGASPAEDIKKQNPDGTTTGDQAGETDGDHKVEDLAKAGRDDLDTDDGQVAEGKWKSTSDGSGTSETD
jgi:hypothetical protein